jgi:hypothetical protein
MAMIHFANQGGRTYQITVRTFAHDNDALSKIYVAVAAFRLHRRTHHYLVVDGLFPLTFSPLGSSTTSTRAHRPRDSACDVKCNIAFDMVRLLGLAKRIRPERNPHKNNCAQYEHGAASDDVAPILFGLTLARGGSIQPSVEAASFERLDEINSLPSGYDKRDQENLVPISHDSRIPLCRGFRPPCGSSAVASSESVRSRAGTRAS